MQSPQTSLRSRKKVPADSPYYQCSREEKHLVAIDWVLSASGKVELISWLRTIDDKPADAMRLEKGSDDTWYIRYSPEENTAYTKTRVATMVF